MRRHVVREHTRKDGTKVRRHVRGDEDPRERLLKPAKRSREHDVFDRAFLNFDCRSCGSKHPGPCHAIEDVPRYGIKKGTSLRGMHPDRLAQAEGATSRIYDNTVQQPPRTWQPPGVDT